MSKKYKIHCDLCGKKIESKDEPNFFDEITIEIANKENEEKDPIMLGVSLTFNGDDVCMKCASKLIKQLFNEPLQSEALRSICLHPDEEEVNTLKDGWGD